MSARRQPVSRMEEWAYRLDCPFKGLHRPLDHEGELLAQLIRQHLAQACRAGRRLSEISRFETQIGPLAQLKLTFSRFETQKGMAGFNFSAGVLRKRGPCDD